MRLLILIGGRIRRWLKMKNRLEELGEIFMSYKSDIEEVMKWLYKDLAVDIEDIMSIDGSKAYEFVKKSRDIDVKYGKLTVLKNLMVMMDEMYKELMIVESLLEKVKKGGGNGED